MGGLTVYFDGQFWVGLVTGTRKDGASGLAKVVFGAEPTNAQLVDWVRSEYQEVPLLEAGSAVDLSGPSGNPKRRQRQAQRLLDEPVVGTSSQRALKAAIEARKTVVEAEQRAVRVRDEALAYQKRVEKRKRKKRGK